MTPASYTGRILLGERSRAYSRIVSSIQKRSPPVSRTRLLSTSECERVEVGVADRLGRLERAAAARRRRAGRTAAARPARAGRSSSRSSPRSVCCRSGASRAPPVSSGRRCSSRASSASGDSTLTRAAASSIASGRPSRRRQISAHALSSAAKLGLDRARPLDEQRDRLGLRASGGTGYSLLAGEAQRLAARDEQLQARAGGEQLGEPAAPRRAPARSCRAQQQLACRADVLGEAVLRRRAPARSSARRAPGRASGAERHQADAVREVARRPRPRPAARGASCPAARAGQRHERASLAQQRDHLGRARARGRRAASAGTGRFVAVERPERRELAPSPSW